MGKKKRKKKQSIEQEYEPYKDLPYDSDELIVSFINENKYTKKQLKSLIEEYHRIRKIKKKKIKFIIDMVPKGTPRPRLNLFRKCIYVEGAKDNWEFFKKLVDTGKIEVNEIIMTPVKMDIKFFLPMPRSLSKNEKILAEKRVIHNCTKPDWDNLGKTTDMFNETLWIDDALADDVRVRKFYSFKPRIEVKIKYLEDFDCKYNEKKMKSSKTYKRLYKHI